MCEYSNFKIKGEIIEVKSRPKRKENCNKQWWEVCVKYKNRFEEAECVIIVCNLLDAKDIKEGDPFFVKLSRYKKEEDLKYDRA